MAGFRAGGWTCCGVIATALLIALVGMRGVGLVGQQRTARSEKPELTDIEMAPRRRESSEERTADTASVATLAIGQVDAGKSTKEDEN